jgi:hypothetical protein
MKILSIFLLFLTLNSYADQDLVPNPFATDFCTMYKEGPANKPDAWKHCCVEHDLYFWAGGSLEDKKTTDLRLKSCVDKSGYPGQARLIYTAVTIGGASPIHIKDKQWGNAWVNRIRYLSLTEEETSAILLFMDRNNFELPASLKQSFKEQLNSRMDAK